MWHAQGGKSYEKKINLKDLETEEQILKRTWKTEWNSMGCGHLAL